MSLIINMLGQRFSHWTVLSKGETPNGGGGTYWFCRCDCGTERLVSGYTLREGKCQSCGCVGGRRLSHKEVLSRISSNIELLSQYDGYHSLAKFRCKSCGHRWRTTMRKVLYDGHGCRLCNRQQAAMNRRLPGKDVLGRIAKQHHNITVIGSEYTMATAAITAHCHQCGRKWKTTPQRLYQGKGCWPCRVKASGQARRLTIEEVRSRIHPDIILSGYYRDKGTKVHARCRICYHEWFPLPGNLFKGDICPKCEDKRSGEKMRLTQQEVIARLRKVSPKIEVIGRYQGAHQPLKVRCRHCGYHWAAGTPWRLLTGGGCPACAGYGFQPNKAAIVYYVRISDHRGGFVYKIGITNRTVRERFGRDYERLTEIKVWPFNQGSEARDFEQEILRSHRSHRYQGSKVFTIGVLNSEIFTHDVLNLDALMVADLK